MAKYKTFTGAMKAGFKGRRLTKGAYFRDKWRHTIDEEKALENPERVAACCAFGAVALAIGIEPVQLWNEFPELFAMLGGNEFNSFVINTNDSTKSTLETVIADIGKREREMRKRNATSSM